jgi:predicted transcriptional regulator
MAGKNNRASESRSKRRPEQRTRHKDPKFLKELGKRLRSLRVSKGYSIDRMYLEGEHLSRATICRIEQGQSDPQISTLKRIAEIIGVPLREIIG